MGWSEPAATSAPVQDEAVQAVSGMNQKHILFPSLGVFQLLSLPQNFPLSLTSPLGPPPFLPLSPHFLFTSSSKLGRTLELSSLEL